MAKPLTISLGVALGALAALVSGVGGGCLGLDLPLAGLLAFSSFILTWFGSNYLVRIPIEDFDGLELTEPITTKSRVSEIVALAHALDGVRRRYVRSSQIRKNLLHSMSDGFQIIDSNNVTIEVNPSLCEIIGSDRAHFIAHSDPFFYLNDVAKEEAFAFLELARSGECQPRSCIETTLRASDGSQSKVSLRMGCLWFESGDDYCITIMVIDKAAEKAGDLSLSEINQMRVLGKFAAGIGHNLNNLLTSILSAVSVLEWKATQSDRSMQLRMTSIIRQATEKSAMLAAELLQMARIREGRQGRRPTDLSKVLGEVVAVSMSLKCSTRYDFVVNKPGIPILALSEESGLHQVLLNLVTNALDAMPDGGKIEITLTSSACHAGESVAISVTDHGSGMSAATQSRIFEPFFTTKKSEQAQTIGGSGLGLSSARALVESWGGAIECESSLGKGTTFTVYLQGIAAQAELRPPLS